MEKYDLIIVGAGPAGIFTAVELLRHGSKKKMLLVEKGKPVEKRHCPKAEVGHCVNCRPTCAITTGFSGAGAFSDGKLSLSYEVGGDLPTLIGEEFAQELIDYTDKIYLEFGADPHVEGIYTGEDIKEIRKNAIHAGLKLVDCPIRRRGDALQYRMREHHSGRGRLQGRAAEGWRQPAACVRGRGGHRHRTPRRRLAGKDLRRAPHRP